MKLEGVISTSDTEVAIIPVIHRESSSSTSSLESDSSNGGIEADTEESITSEEELDKPIGSAPEVKDPAKDKWVAVKGQQTSSET